ncbi:mono [ADP-ribose] polymerase PARP16 [Biomphalaria glabrata]|uniref:Poly [ADP-ribose] polymerase n=1 Tax=Biomphalaria glabrata TaxID=6526 RepID=A0A2C9K3K8_BIOGL|nr:mono [ADP-ribose] polymerase PARP16-like [Biomphalaria glabrata]
MSENIENDEMLLSEGVSKATSSKKEVSLSSLLNCDLYACDLLWSLFVAAAKSYRFNSILHPFPPMYSSDTVEEKNIPALRDVISRVPALLSNSNFDHILSKDCKELLSWVLTTKHFSLKLCDKESCFQTIKELTGQVMSTTQPDFVFEVVYSLEKERKFEQLKGSRKTFFAYHGSRLDNFYSILHNGLNSYLNKVGMFGEGTYLSSELSVSLIYSPNGEGWRNSCVGAKLSCVAVCEMIDDASVKCQIKKGSTSEQKQRAKASNITEDVPEKYYVVQNDDVIRVKYLLIYKLDTVSPVSTRSQTAMSWLQEYKFPLLMLAYFILLAAIGLVNSRLVVNSLTRFYKSLTL